MPAFKKNNRFSGSSKGSFGNRGGDRSYGPRDSYRSDAPRETFEAKCNSCGTSCQVPFRPNGKKPVYCSNCFKREDDRPARPSFQKREFTPRSESVEVADLKKQLHTIQATLEKLVHIVETSQRAQELTKEVQRHIPVSEEIAPKKAVKKVAKPRAKK